MAFTNKEDAIVALQIHMTAAATILSNDGIEAAVDDAMTELGWSFPVTDARKCSWIIKRAARHASFILWLAAAQKFKYKQVNLQQRFEHYDKVIKTLDTEYEMALANNPDLFANVEAYKLFGTSVGAGFKYDGIGRDITYEDLQRYIATGE